MSKPVHIDSRLLTIHLRFIQFPPQLSDLSHMSTHHVYVHDNNTILSYMGVSIVWVPQNGWFIWENPIKMVDLGLPPFMEPPNRFK